MSFVYGKDVAYRMRWALGIVALFFNPIIPVYLRRQTWGFIDVGAALLLFSSSPSIRVRRQLHRATRGRSHWDNGKKTG